MFLQFVLNINEQHLQYYQLCPNLSQKFVCSVSKRCLEDKYWEILNFFLSTGSLSYNDLGEDLFTALIRENQLVRFPFSFSQSSFFPSSQSMTNSWRVCTKKVLLKLAIEKIDDLPSATMINLLRYFLKEDTLRLADEYVAKQDAYPFTLYNDTDNQLAPKYFFLFVPLLAPPLFLYASF